MLYMLHRAAIKLFIDKTINYGYFTKDNLKLMFGITVLESSFYLSTASPSIYGL